MTGLTKAIVYSLESSDPANQGKIELTITDADGLTTNLWAIFVSAYTGVNIYPEIGDEVIIGFLQNDPNQALILGTTRPQYATPQPPISNNNTQKIILTKNGLSIGFDDEKKTVLIQTPAGNKVLLNDDTKSIELYDQNNNSVVLKDSGITLDSPANIQILSKGNIKLEATGKLSLKAGSEITLEGMSITQTAQTSFTAKGNASAELSASGQTTIKGGIVMIN